MNKKITKITVTSIIAISFVLISFGIFSAVNNNVVQEDIEQNNQILGEEETKKSILLQITNTDNTISEYTIEFSGNKSAFEVLKNLSENNDDFSFTYQDYGGDLGASPLSFNDQEIDSSNQFWLFLINGTISDKGISSYELQNQDILSFTINPF